MASSTQERRRGSVDAHHAATAITDAPVALMSYNIGINNNEPTGTKSGSSWHTMKYKKLQDDVKAAFHHGAGIQILLLSEFGNMVSSIDKEFASGVSETGPLGANSFS